MAAAHKGVVAILNTSPDFIELLTEVLDIEGFETVPAYIVEFRKGRLDVREFVAQYQPDVIVYDIAGPYPENWQFFNEFRGISGLKACQFVLVTTNKQALGELVGETGSLEIIGKPLDLDGFIEAVKKSLEDCE